MEIEIIKEIENPKEEIILLVTKREKQILKLISLEFSDKEISNQLHLSHHTVHSHRKNLMLKFDVKKSVGLVRKAYELKILPY